MQEGRQCIFVFLQEMQSYFLCTSLFLTCYFFNKNVLILLVQYFGYLLKIQFHVDVTYDSFAFTWRNESHVICFKKLAF